MTKQIFKPVLFWIMTLGLLWSCQEPLESPLDTTDLSLQEAQSFYEEIQAQAKILSQNSKADKRTKKTPRQAHWDKQEKYKLGNQELISIPILFDDDLNTPGYGFKKMVFYKDTKTNKTNARIIEYILDRTYLAQNFGKLSNQTYTGMMIVYDAEGSYMDGLAIKDGKQTNRVGVGLDGQIMIAKNANGRESATTSDCETSYTGYECNFGGNALGTASNQGGYTVNDLFNSCGKIVVQYIGNCNSSGGGSISGIPSPTPLPIAPYLWEAFSGFSGGGSSGWYAYNGPNTGASITQNIGATLPSDVNPQEYFQTLSTLGISCVEDLPGTPIFIIKGAYATIKQKVSLTMAVIRYRNPTWSEAKVFVEAYKMLVSTPIHFALDVAGLVPGAGEIFDLISGGLYVIEGDPGNATVSLVAMAPIGGQIATLGRWTKNALEVVDNAGTFRSVNGIIYSTRQYVVDTRSGHALNHIYDHFKDDLTKDFQGVFTIPTNEIAGLIDEAWDLKNRLNIAPIVSGTKHIYTIPMGIAIGKQGGRLGSQQPLTKIKLIFDGTTFQNIVTAYPVAN